MDQRSREARVWWRRLIELGVDDDTPGRDRKNIIPLNVVCVVVFCMGIAFVVPATLQRDWAMVAVVVSFHLASTALTLALSAMRRPAAAAVFFFTAALSTLVGQVVLWGTDLGIQAFLLGCAVGPFLMFPTTAIRFAYVYAIAAAVLWTTIEVNRPIVGLASPPGDYFIGGNIPMIGVLLVLIGGYFRSNAEEGEDELEAERRRSDQLLLNILPAPIAERLKADDQQTIADRFEAVTVLFCDLVGFTKLSARTDPADLVRLLDEIFSRFDDLSDEHGLEKIKTIGDSYMAAAGLPEPREDHALAVAAMALDMVEAIAEFSRRTGSEMRVRVGIASGPVVAGVIGKRKFVYDLWGDVVNTAARMESHGSPDRIQVTDVCRDLLVESFVLEARGPVDIKGKGEMHTYWLLARA